MPDNQPSITDLKEFLNEKVILYNQPAFIETDPIQVPRSFSEKENIEIAAFFSATLAWGNRQTIIRNARKLMQLMENQPYDFVLNSSEKEVNQFDKFAHRTFNGNDCRYFIRSLKNIYKNHGGLQNVFETGYRKNKSVKTALEHFHTRFFELAGERTRKHISNVAEGSAGKRLNMFLRWMVRTDANQVDFGLWNGIPASHLFLPLDVHTGNTARKLGLLQRKQNDWKAVEEITAVLRKFDPTDPVKYDFALFGLGAFEKF